VFFSIGLVFFMAEPGILPRDFFGRLALEFGWANLVVLGGLILASLLGSLKHRNIDPFDGSLLWLSLPALAMIPTARTTPEALIYLALSFPFLLALIGRMAFSGASKLTLSLVCLALTFSHLPYAVDGMPFSNNPWLHVQWASNAEKSFHLKTLIQTLAQDMDDTENIILTAPDKTATLDLLTQHPVIPYPPEGPTSSYAHLYKAGFWILEHEPDGHQLEQAEAILGGLRFLKRVNIGRSGKSEQQFWVFQFDQLRSPF